jgi:hypothetical protein
MGGAMARKKEKADESESSKKAKAAKVGDLLKELIDASEKPRLKGAAKVRKRRKPAP